METYYMANEFLDFKKVSTMNDYRLFRQHLFSFYLFYYPLCSVVHD